MGKENKNGEERRTDRQIQTDRHRQMQRDRQTDADRQTETDRHRQRNKQTNTKASGKKDLKKNIHSTNKLITIFKSKSPPHREETALTPQKIRPCKAPPDFA